MCGGVLCNLRDWVRGATPAIVVVNIPALLGQNIEASVASHGVSLVTGDSTFAAAVLTARTVRPNLRQAGNFFFASWLVISMNAPSLNFPFLSYLKGACSFIITPFFLFSHV